MRAAPSWRKHHEKPPKARSALRRVQRPIGQPHNRGPQLKILDIRPSPPGSTTLARFDLELNDHLRLYNLGLRQRGNGHCWSVAPNAFSERTAAFGEQFNR